MSESIRFTAAACALAQAIYYSRAEAFALYPSPWESLPRTEMDTWILRAAELLRTIQPTPRVIGTIRPETPWGEAHHV